MTTFQLEDVNADETPKTVFKLEDVDADENPGPEQGVKMPQIGHLQVFEGTDEPIMNAVKGALDPHFSVGEHAPVFGTLAARAGRAVSGGIEPKKSYEQERGDFEKKYPETAVAADVFAGAATPSLVGPMGKVAEGMFNITEKSPAIARGLGSVINATGRVAGTSAETAADAYTRGDIPIQDAVETAGGIQALIQALGLTGQAASSFMRRAVAGIPHQAAERYRTRRAEINALDPQKVVDEARGERLGAQQKIREKKDVYQDARQGELGDAPERLIGDIKRLRGDVSRQSGEAFDSIKDAGPIDVKPVVGRLVGMLDGMKLSGKKESVQDLAGMRHVSEDAVSSTSPGQEQARQYGTILKYIKELQKFDTMDPQSMKKVIQSIDSDIEDVYQAKRTGQYAPLSGRMLQTIRNEINAELVKLPGYAPIMQKLAPDTELARKMNKLYREPQATGKKLRTLDNYDTRDDTKLMGDFDKRMGSNYLGEMRAQSDNIKAKKTDLEGLEQKLGPMTRQDPANVLYSVAVSKGPKKAIMNKSTIDTMSEFSGKNYSDVAQDLGVKHLLEGGGPNGSRVVNLASLSLAGIVGAMGGSGRQEAAAKAVGAILGAEGDYSSRKVWKFFSDVAANPKTQALMKPLYEAIKKGPRAFIDVSNTLSETNPDYAQFLRDNAGTDLKMSLETKK